MNNGSSASRTIERLPMVIGVTGHRDLREDEHDKLTAAVTECFAKLRKLCPHTPMILLSSLAEGADQLVARVALDMKFEADDAKLGPDDKRIKLVVPLPMALPEYERDFRHEDDAVPGPDTTDGFRALFDRAEHHVVLPPAPGHDPGQISQQGAARDAQYELAGSYIVRNSHVLIALWDGFPPDAGAVGGTAHIVRYRRDGQAPQSSSSPLDVIDDGPLIHIACSRQGSSPAAGDPASFRVLMPSEPDPGEERENVEPAFHEHLELTPFATGLQRLDTYNREARCYARLRPSRLALRAEDPAPSEDALPAGSAGRLILRQYVVADRLAILFYRLRRWVNGALFSIVVFAVAFVALYEHVHEQAWLLGLYLGAMALAWAIFWAARHFDFHNKHLDYRALAEGLRVQLFWCLAGVDKDVSDHYLRKQRTELEWLREALRTQMLLQQWKSPCLNAAAEPAALLAAIRTWTLPRWLAGEHAFFSDATQRNHGKTALRERLENSLLTVGLLLAAVAWAMQLKDVCECMRAPLIVLMVLAPTIAAALSGYSKQMAFAPQAKRYQWMAALFLRAQQRLTEALDNEELDDARRLSDAQGLLFELGTEALGENGDWVMMHREREPEAPSAG